MKNTNFMEKLEKIGNTLSYLSVGAVVVSIVNAIILLTAHPDQIFVESDTFIGMANVEPIMTATVIYSMGIAILLFSFAMMIWSFQKKIRRYAREQRQFYCQKCRV